MEKPERQDTPLSRIVISWIDCILRSNWEKDRWRNGIFWVGMCGDVFLFRQTSRWAVKKKGAQKYDTGSNPHCVREKFSLNIAAWYKL